MTKIVITDRERDVKVATIDMQMDKLEKVKKEKILVIEKEFADLYKELLERKIKIYELWKRGR